jgi:carboxyl-terminal processing protease
MDFTIDENYSWDREETQWAKTEADLDEFWRQRVKNDYLRLRLTDKEDEAIIETLDDRYENLDRRISELNSDDIFQFFMNAFAQSIEPHTAYMSPRSSENFEISMRLSLEGIGALLGRENERHAQHGLRKPSAQGGTQRPLGVCHPAPRCRAGRCGLPD